MKHKFLKTALISSALILGSGGSWAQLAPGSDPIVINQGVSYLALPIDPMRPSEDMHLSTGTPAFLSAKIARYEAKAFAALEGGSGVVRTEKDVVSRQTGNALQRTCVTDVASNTIAPTVGPSGQYGPSGGSDQIAVLRGDVVTICK